MGYYSKTSTAGPVVGNEKSRCEVFPAGDARNAPSRHATPLANQGDCAVGSATFAPGVPLYGYRHLSTELGRWPSREPIGEDAFTAYSKGELADRLFLLHLMFEKTGIQQDSLYTFVGNSPFSEIDAVGLLCFVAWRYTRWVDTGEKDCGDWIMMRFPPWWNPTPFWPYYRFCTQKRCQERCKITVCIDCDITDYTTCRATGKCKKRRFIEFGLEVPPGFPSPVPPVG